MATKDIKRTSEKTTEEKELTKKEKIKNEIIDWAKSILYALVIALFLTQVVFINSSIVSGSMEKTIMTGDRAIGLRFAYWFNEPQRGDIIMFRRNDDPDKKILIKRIIGMPGDTLEIKDGIVIINGKKLEEPYLDGTEYGSWGPYVLEEDQYFMMGDNRNISADARFWTRYYITKKEIIGRAVLVYWKTPKLLKRIEYNI